MTPSLNQKIFWHAAVWAVVSAGALFFVFPRLAKSLENMQNSHAAQISELNDLKNHAKGVQLMQSDLASLKGQTVQPDQLFTSDLQLVNEIKHIEQSAQASGLQMDPLGVSGSTDKAAGAPSRAHLLTIPFTATVHGDFPSALKFIQFFEHNYFISPINGISMSVNEKGVYEMKVLSNFYLRKQ